jgi:hypothetical protein
MATSKHIGPTPLNAFISINIVQDRSACETACAGQGKSIRPVEERSIFTLRIGDTMLETLTLASSFPSPKNPPTNLKSRRPSNRHHHRHHHHRRPVHPRTHLPSENNSTVTYRGSAQPQQAVPQPATISTAYPTPAPKQATRLPPMPLPPRSSPKRPLPHDKPYHQHTMTKKKKTRPKTTPWLTPLPSPRPPPNHHNHNTTSPNTAAPSRA